MYVTRTLSQYRQILSSVSSSALPEGPNSGHLVIQDEESVGTCCFGLCKDRYLKDLPFPQNKVLTVEYTVGGGENSHTESHKVFFIPVLDQPLSSNRYYVIKARGPHKGEAYTSSREEDKVTCCFFCKCVKDLKPRALNHQDVYQQFEVIPHEGTCFNGGFLTKSVAQDGFPPEFLRRKGWSVYASTPQYYYELGEASGVDASLRSRLPQFDFPISHKSSKTVVIGKWYCPFMFVKEEEGKLNDQMKRSMFYEMTLEQEWEQIYTCENYENHNMVAVDVLVERDLVLLSGKEEVVKRNVVDGVMWFDNGGRGCNVGLSMAIVERMKWEEERVGLVWIDGRERERKVRVERVEKFGGVESGWRKFGCYALVERFCLKRMDGSLVLSFAFTHTNQIQSKWE